MKTVLTKCPYCGLKTEINVEELRDISSLVICDVMEGGCDRIFRRRRVRSYYGIRPKGRGRGAAE